MVIILSRKFLSLLALCLHSLCLQVDASFGAGPSSAGRMHSPANNQESDFFQSQPGFFPTGNSPPGVSASSGAPPGHYYSPLVDPQLESRPNFSPTYNYFQSNPTLVQHYYPGSNSQTNTRDSFNVVNNVNSDKTNQEPEVLRKGPLVHQSKKKGGVRPLSRIAYFH